MFSQLCGDAALDKAVLVTSKWSRQGDRNFVTRENELKTVHWKEMLHPPKGEVGARVMRLGGPRRREDPNRTEGDDAWAVIHGILGRLDRRLAEGDVQKTLAEVLQIQDELVKRRGIPETEAAKELRDQLQAALRVQEEMPALEAQAADGDEVAEAKIREKEDELRRMHTAIQQNRASFFARFRRFLGFR